jgi:hypothetical protein
MPNTGEIEIIRIACKAEAALFCLMKRAEDSSSSDSSRITVAEEIVELQELHEGSEMCREEVDLAPPREK